MAGEKAPQIVIKKITVVAGGAHGGAWKVAFADFMTAMMAFFLVMWLLATSSEAEKKAVSDYFSTPSVIEYQFQNFGVELTLEKLFLDLINEPLKTLDGFITPMDRSPNVLNFGMKKIVMSYMADQLGTMASNVEVGADSVTFEIPDNLLFDKGTATPSGQFVSVMERVKGVTKGLQDADVNVTSVVYRQSVPQADPSAARNVADQRLDIIETKIKGGLEDASVTVTGESKSQNEDRGPKGHKLGGGFVRFEIKQKKVTPDGKKPKPMVDSTFGPNEQGAKVYDDFVDKVSQRKANAAKSKAEQDRANRVRDL